MRWSDWKYLCAFVAPLSTALGLWAGGWASFAGVFVGFVLVPLCDLLFPESTENLSREDEARKEAFLGFDVLLYLNLPIVYGLVGYYLYCLHTGELTPLEKTGMTLSVGLMLGTQGINVAHELGHRAGFWPQTVAKWLLLPSLYVHFFIEHNRGHHRNVGTPEDPATSRLNETVYAFWVRSLLLGYLHAWKLEALRLRKSQQTPWSLQNQMVRFEAMKLFYLGVIFAWVGAHLLPYVLGIAGVGVLMLETVNYIEHYGLARREVSEGRYETVSPSHSWNSNHEAGRWVLYELSRHSDHHFKASRKFQVLRHFAESPQLPWGYPASILLSLCPPLWFSVMNPQVARCNARGTEST